MNEQNMLRIEINVENKDEYLVNEYHLNEKGIEAVADRFCYFFGNSKR